jgi:hypothetical protein
VDGGLLCRAVGIVAVDVSSFGVVMSADSQPVERLDGETRVLAQQGELTRCPIVIHRGGGFTGFTGYVGTEEIDGRTTRDWLTAFGTRHAGTTLGNYAAALGDELTAVWQRLGVRTVLEILISGVENGEVRFWFVRNSDGLYDHDWTYRPLAALTEVGDLYDPSMEGLAEEAPKHLEPWGPEWTTWLVEETFFSA